jgi:hypothetical protein
LPMPVLRAPAPLAYNRICTCLGSEGPGFESWPGHTLWASSWLHVVQMRCYIGGRLCQCLC